MALLHPHDDCKQALLARAGQLVRALVAVLLVAALALFARAIYPAQSASALAPLTDLTATVLNATDKVTFMRSPALGTPLYDDDKESRCADDAEASGDLRQTDRVEAILQNPEFPSGCESVSLTIALRAAGFDVTAAEIIDGYLPTDPSWNDFVTSFAGDPRSGGGAMPPAIERTADAYFAAVGSELDAVDLTGASFDEVAAIAESGHPVLVWTTMYMAEPQWLAMWQDDYEWYRNEHCVVLYGIEGDKALVSDPLEGLVERDLGEFARLYEACGTMALCFSDALA